VWLASGTLYRIRVYGRDYLPDSGGAVLVSNHPSWLDGFLVLLASSRPVRLVAWEGNFKIPLLRRIGEFWGAIYVSTGPKSIRRALETAREAVRRGELVCIFPEGGVGRTGQVQGFRPGVMKILEGIDVPVVPIYLDELWGSIFSFERGKFFWKWPRRWPYPISIHFGPPVREPQNLQQVRRAVQELGTTAVQQRTSRMLVPQRNFLRRCKDRLFSEKIADSTGASLSGGQLLARTLVLRRLLRRHVLAADEKYVGLLLPPTAGGIVSNAALALDRRIAVNLNYTTSSEVMNQCIRRSGIRHVLTSEKFLEKLKERQPIELEAELVPLETLRDKPTVVDKLVAALSAYVAPSFVLDRCLGLRRIDPDDVLTVIFTSGSTGEPKGAMLTHANVASNVEAMNQVVHLRRSDVLIGALPLFHSFGYTVATWSVLSIDVKGVYHYNPLDAKLIGKLCGKYRGTIFLATPTFLRSYLRRCDKEDFATLDILIAGAEKLPGDLSQAFYDKFGVRPVEGYGATELSPLVSVNVPPSRSRDNFQIDCKEGTVGRTVPGVAAKVLDLETGAELGADQPGMLWIKGPNVMKGYLGRPDLTDEVIRDGWYMTGDVAKIDADGFITITGRESRFSKIGGEMVPHIYIEEVLARLVGIDEDGAPKVAVTAVPHPTKGERLVVVHAPLERSPKDLCDALAAEGLPNLFIPSADSFCQVDALPVLGSGKLDLVGVKKVALERFGVE
jgi:acyl-[acyl-carrier-protein]-phospholipid O-acyltransferase/long-chain-fatty-acid--[acyl-carrier-protein] ligase